jgi:hypothetical protein
VIRAQLAEYLLAVKTGVFVALPSINGVNLRIDAELLDRLAKAQKRVAGVRSELDDRARTVLLD